MIEITSDFTGGNINVVDLDGDTVTLKNELRDTEGDWFYWAFCVKGAGGKSITFRFSQNNRVGYYGAAVSHDLKSWHWSDSKIDGEAFTYNFADGEDCVYFAHHMLYHPDRFLELAKEIGIETRQLCISERGRSVPCAVIGGGDKTVLLTSRHHACESTGDYVLEGVIRSLAQRPIDGYSFFVVPFVDYDGVVDGDQGKNRAPHDHNRDYVDTIYNSTAAIKEYAESHNTVLGFDFHSPWHCGGRNDKLFFVQKGEKHIAQFAKFGRLFEQSVCGGAMKYYSENDIAPNTDWNKDNSPNYSNYVLSLPNCRMALSLETAYFGEENNRFSQDGAVQTGKCYANALRRYIED